MGTCSVGTGTNNQLAGRHDCATRTQCLLSSTWCRQAPLSCSCAARRTQWQPWRRCRSRRQPTARRPWPAAPPRPPAPAAPPAAAAASRLCIEHAAESQRQPCWALGAHAAACVRSSAYISSPRMSSAAAQTCRGVHRDGQPACRMCVPHGAVEVPSTAACRARTKARLHAALLLFCDGDGRNVCAPFDQRRWLAASRCNHRWARQPGAARADRTRCLRQTKLQARKGDSSTDRPDQMLRKPFVRRIDDQSISVPSRKLVLRQCNRRLIPRPE